MNNPNPENSNLPPERPVDKVFEGRREAIASRSCNPENIGGCGRKLADPLPVNFKDEISYKEYLISGFCQTCQDQIFNQTEEETEGEDDGSI